MSLLPVDSTNRDCLDMIERCIFVLCLDTRLCSDDAASGDTQWRDDVSLALQMVHGSGTAHNTCNRWFDKTMQVGDRGRHGKAIRVIHRTHRSGNSGNVMFMFEKY